MFTAFWDVRPYSLTETDSHFIAYSLNLIYYLSSILIMKAAEFSTNVDISTRIHGVTFQKTAPSNVNCFRKISQLARLYISAMV
jgi:hypothetical protein